LASKADYGANLFATNVCSDPITKNLLRVGLRQVLTVYVENVAVLCDVTTSFVFALLKLLVIKLGKSAHEVRARGCENRE